MSFVHNKACPGVGHAASWPMSFTSTIISRVRAFNHPRSESLHSFNLIGIVVSLDVEWYNVCIGILGSFCSDEQPSFFSLRNEVLSNEVIEWLIRLKWSFRAMFIYSSSVFIKFNNLVFFTKNWEIRKRIYILT